MPLGQIGFSSTRIIVLYFYKDTPSPKVPRLLALSLLLSFHTSSIYYFDSLSSSAQYSKFPALYLKALRPWIIYILSSCPDISHVAYYPPGSHFLISHTPLFWRSPFPNTCTTSVSTLLLELKCWRPLFPFSYTQLFTDISYYLNS